MLEQRLEQAEGYGLKPVRVEQPERVPADALAAQVPNDVGAVLRDDLHVQSRMRETVESGVEARLEAPVGIDCYEVRIDVEWPVGPADRLPEPEAGGRSSSWSLALRPLS